MTLYYEIYKDLDEDVGEACWGIPGFVQAYINKKSALIDFDEAMRLYWDVCCAINARSGAKRIDQIIRMIAEKTLRRYGDKES